jgi:hypothetical protein
MMGATIRQLAAQWPHSAAYRFAFRSWFVQLGALAAGFGLMRLLADSMLRQREGIYFQPFLGWSFFSRALPAVVACVLTAWLLANARRVNWRRLGRGTRVVVGVVMVVAAWSIAGIGFNYYTGEAYFADRALILLLLAAALWRPAFCPLLLAYLMFFFGQHHGGAGDFELTDKFPIIDAISAFIAWMVLRTVLPMRVRTFMWFLIALQAINYLAPAIAKLTLDHRFNPLGWYTENPLHLMSVTAYAHGWFYWMNEPDVIAIAQLAQRFDVILAIFTMVVEAGVICALWRRSAALWLAGVVVLHIGIFSLTGIMFWKWIVLDLALVWWLLKAGRDRRVRFRVLAMIALIAAFPLYAKPKFLGWLDTPVSEHYFIEVETDDGTYRVDQADFSPFDITFEQGALHYVNDGPVVTYSWGAALNYPFGVRLHGATTPGEVRAIIVADGKVRANEKHAKVLDDFLQKFFTNVNEHGDMRRVGALGPPRHMQVRSGEPRFQFDRLVRRVRVRFIRTFYDGEVIHTLDDRVLRTVEVP